jgi:hypothetical protein
MIRLTSPAAIAVVFVLALTADPASALTTRTFVSATGADSGTCARPTPCRTLQFAHDQTADSGEIGILDSAGYGALVITKAISIVNPGGVEAGILATVGGTAVTINAGAGEAVSLRGLTLEGAGSGDTGILLNTAASLTILDCVVRRFTTNGIFLGPTGATAFFIGSTVVADNAQTGIAVSPQGTGTAEGAIDRIAAINNAGGPGIYIHGASTTGATLKVTVTNSVLHRNNYGIYADSSAGHAATSVTVAGSSASSNGFGVTADGSTMRLSGNVATFNGTGVRQTGTATLTSFGNNLIRGNGTDVSGTLTPDTLQ